jgi:flagellar hook protein FlgE
LVYAQLAAATVANPQALQDLGSANKQVTGASGKVHYGAFGSADFGKLQAGAVAKSNIDLMDNSVKIGPQRGNFTFQLNAASAMVSMDREAAQAMHVQ